MRDRTPITVGALVILVLFFPLGYLLHVSPRFAGSILGTLIGILAAILSMTALSYPVVKRVPRIHAWASSRVRPPTLLAIHIYAGVVGPILGLIHSGHKFNSPIGITVVALMIVVILSGYAGRFLLARIAKAMRGRSGDLAALQLALGQAPYSRAPADTWTIADLVFEKGTLEAWPSERDLALGLADVEDAVRTEGAVQKALRPWLVLHIISSIAFVIVLLLHVLAAVYFGLRWL